MLLKNRFFITALFLILTASFLLRVLPTKNDNFFFTMDQGRDALFVREILERHKLILKGPETTIQGIYAGPLWYYFIAIGYALFLGHPFGGVFMVIVLSLATTAFLMYFFAKNLSVKFAVFLGIVLQFFWPFYDTSRWAFNPFPLVLLGILLTTLLAIFLTGKKKAYYWALVPVVLAFNSNIAGAAVFFIFFALVGLWAVTKRKLGAKEYLLSTFTIPGILSLFVIKQIVSIVNQTAGSNAGQIESVSGIFSGLNYINLAKDFAKIFSQSLIPQSFVGSIIIYVFALAAFVRQKSQPLIRNFSLLVFFFLIVSFIWFGWNKGWKDWHTVYLPTLVFVSALAMLWQQKRFIATALVLLILVSQALVFTPRYNQYFQSSDDPAILKNQLTVLDWIYSKNEENGFNAYTYMTSSYFDYPYQYHFWWYGKGKYKHVPCHYEVYPKSHKYIYVPGGEFNYNTPTLGCDRLIFLIKEPIKPSGQGRYDDWLKNYENTRLIESHQVGQITVEKREIVR